MRRPKLLVTIAAVAGMALALTSQASAANRVAAAKTHPHIDCSQARFLCTEVADSDQVFGEGHYVR
jgi:hypothetical protein